ncbi:MAG: hypothetical protein WCQ99_15115, partial [Pseudomonadota bacterium]
ALGSDVKSLVATGLPVGLAIALLKDRNGEIRLDLPVTGSLDDPRFSVAAILLKTVVNLLEKAAASPFALLGSAFTGGSDLSYVAFDCGSAAIGDEEAKKLDAMTQVLSNKPDIKLEIQGRADPVHDREGLKEYAILRKLKALKLKNIFKQGRAADTADDIVIEQDEYDFYLTQAYRAEKFEKPSIFGIPRTIPAGEMKKLMIENSIVTDDDLQQLMELRAIAVKNRIIDTAKVKPERLFIIEPKLSLEMQCRVDFRLK